MLAYVKPKVSQKMNDHQSHPFTDEEIRKALLDMPPTKFPRPDGMNGLFFQKYWDIVGKDVTEAALLILNSGGDIHQWNTTSITLIPKIKHPN